MTIKDSVHDIVTLTNIFSDSEEINGFSDLFEYEKYESEEYDTLKKVVSLSNNYLGLLKLAVINDCTLKEIDELFKDEKYSEAIEKLSDLRELTEGVIDISTVEDSERDDEKSLAMKKLTYKIAGVDY